MACLERIELPTYYLAYHYSFHYQFPVCGLDYVFTKDIYISTLSYRYFPFSLYTFLISSLQPFRCFTFTGLLYFKGSRGL